MGGLKGKSKMGLRKINEKLNVHIPTYTYIYAKKRVKVG